MKINFFYFCNWKKKLITIFFKLKKFTHVSVDWVKIGVGGQNCNRK